MIRFQDRLGSWSWLLCALAAQATACVEPESPEDIAIATSALTSPPQPSLNGSTCTNFGTIFSSGNVYYVMNNVFNDAQGSQCITASGTGFTVTTANHNIATNGAPAAYTAFVRGCHFGTCTSGSNLPKVVSTIAGAA